MNSTLSYATHISNITHLIELSARMYAQGGYLLARGRWRIICVGAFGGGLCACHDGIIYVYKSIHINTQTYMYIYIYIYIYIYTYIHTYMYIFICIHIYIYIYVCVFIYIDLIHIIYRHGTHRALLRRRRHI